MNSVKRLGNVAVIVIALLLAVPPVIVIAGVSTFVSGLSAPTGIAVHPSLRKLYINSGVSGKVWTVEILPGGTAGLVSTLTEGFVPDLDVIFDAAGNLYGNEVGTNYFYRLGSDGQVSRMSTNERLNTGLCIESPGLPSSKIFRTNDGTLFGYIRPSDFSPNSNKHGQLIGSTCSRFRFMHYRQKTAAIAATYEGTVTNVNPTDGVCSPMISGLVQPNGLAEDADGNLYVADTGSGKVLRIMPSGMSDVVASGLSSPTGLTYDSETNLLFVSETTANRVSVITIDEPPPTETWEMAYASLSTDQQNIDLLRNYRDQILMKDTDGRVISESLYKHSEAALEVLLKNPSILGKASRLLDQHATAVSDVLAGETASIVNSNEVISFLNEYARRSSPMLRLLVAAVIERIEESRTTGNPAFGFYFD